MVPPLKVSPLIARRFARRVHRFDAPFQSVADTLAYHGYIQIDPINICGRMHDLILRNRVVGYREGDLMRHVHGTGDVVASETDTPPVRAEMPRTRPQIEASSSNGSAERPSSRARMAAEQRRAFEHHLPGTGVLVAFPLDAWPHLLGAMRKRSRSPGAWSGKLTPREKILAVDLLAEIAVRGPLGSEDFEDDRRARRVWGASKLVKATLQKLFFHGRLLIAERSNNRRRYDLPERVLPAQVLAKPEPSAAETDRWLALLKLRQRRLAALKRDEVRLVADAVQPVTLAELAPGVTCPPLFCLREDTPLLEAAALEAGTPKMGDSAASAGTRTVTFLAPLDPLIYDRRVTAALWNFDYTWEAYTPAAKRVRGYYALPVLIGTEIVGHVDSKADRESRRLRVVSRRIRRGHAIAPGLREFARWLGLK